MTFPHTAIVFSYDPSESHASERQIGMLLEGLGYLFIGSLHDDDGETRTVSAYKNGYVPLDGNDHEVDAIRTVIGQSLAIDYYRLQATEQVSYTEAGETLHRKLEV